MEKKTVLDSFIALRHVVANSNTEDQGELMDFLNGRIEKETKARERAKTAPKKLTKADEAILARKEAVAALLSETPITAASVSEKTGFTIGQSSSALVALVKAGKAVKGESIKNHNTYVISK